MEPNVPQEPPHQQYTFAQPPPPVYVNVPAPQPIKPKKFLGMSTSVFILVFFVVVAGLGFLGWKLYEGRSFDLKGSLILLQPTSATDLASCSGSGGYLDISGGTDVTVYNASGTIVSSGALDDGLAIEGSCIFDFTVHGVPGNEGPYQVEVSHRGRLTITEANARAGKLSATLGSGS